MAFNWFITLEDFYKTGRYDEEQLRLFVRGGKISEHAYELITGKPYNPVPQEVSEETQPTE